MGGGEGGGGGAAVTHGCHGKDASHMRRYCTIHWHNKSSVPLLQLFSKLPKAHILKGTIHLSGTQGGNELSPDPLPNNNYFLFGKGSGRAWLEARLNVLFTIVSNYGGGGGGLDPLHQSTTISPVVLWFDLGLIAREGFSNVSYSKKKCALQHTKSLKKFSEGKP